ncbi:MAG: Ppx/GppA family phosphatase [Hyphomicrobiales bacterium]|nr:Ppx/GppA family phosphatase [Hyphomicrobiales bacterium]
MLAARPTSDGFRVVDSFSRTVRLGEGLAATGRLAEQAIGRAVEALAVCAEKIRANCAQGHRVVATEACRRAANCREFLRLTQEQTGLTLEPISPEEEARLTLRGCAPLLDPRYPHALIFDIGGGSTELTWVAQAPGEAPRMLAYESFPMGVVNLTESYGSGAMSRQDMNRLIESVDSRLVDFDANHAIHAAVAQGKVQMVGTSGTVTTLGALYLGLGRYARSRVDGLDLDFQAVEELCCRLAALDHDTRAAHPCIGADRAEMVIMGCAILEAICRRWPAGRLRIADRGIREGVLHELIAARD